MNICLPLILIADAAEDEYAHALSGIALPASAEAVGTLCLPWTAMPRRQHSCINSSSIAHDQAAKRKAGRGENAKLPRNKHDTKVYIQG